MNSIKIAGATLAAACIGLTGCTSTKDGGSADSQPSNFPVEVGNTINYSSTGSNTVLDCADGKSLTVGGANNTLTVNGTCATVNIGGTDNKVALNKVTTELDVVGLNATVTYKDGAPKVTTTGKGSTVHKS